MQSKPCGVKMRSKDEYPRERRVRNQASGDLVQKLPRGNFIQKDQAAKNLLRSHGASSKAAMVCRGVGLRSPSDTGFRAQRRFAMVLGIMGYAVSFFAISCGSDFSDHPTLEPVSNAPDTSTPHRHDWLWSVSHQIIFTFQFQCCNICVCGPLFNVSL